MKLLLLLFLIVNTVETRSVENPQIQRRKLFAGL